MIDFDKAIIFSCPDCGQISVSCSLGMILENGVFFCDFCGCEFQGKDSPQWLSRAACMVKGKDQKDLRDMMIAVYAYLYADGPCLDDDLISLLLESNLNLWPLFPQEKIPSPLLFQLLGDDAFVSTFDFSSLTNARIVEILAQRPELISKCHLEKLVENDWLVLLAAHPEFVSRCPKEMLISMSRRKLNPSSIPPEKIEILFDYCPFKNDFRFIQTSPSEQQPGKSASPSLFASDDIFFAFVNFFCLGKYVNWENYSPSALLPVFKKYPVLLTGYPFAVKKLTDYDWNSYSNSDWKHIAAKITLPPELRPVYELRTGKKIAVNFKLHPELECFCNWDVMNSAEWTDLLINFPSVCWSSCKWDVIEEADWNKIIKDGKNVYAISVYEVSHGKNIAANLKKNPDLKKYLNMTIVSASEWLDLLPAFPELAANCPWQKIYQYINDLPAERRESAKTSFPELWKKKKNILSYVNVGELKKLSTDQYYTVLDFFDWEDNFDFSSMTSSDRIDLFSKHPQFGEKYGWDKLSSEEKVQLAIRSQAFCQSYGWDNFTPDEVLKILERHSEYLDKFNPAHFGRSFLLKLVEADENLSRYYKLNLADYLLFRKFKSTKLCAKITFVWHFIICLAVFAGFGYFLYNGPCGFQALWQESRMSAVYAASIYGGIAILWSNFHAWLYSGRTPFFLTLISGILGGLLAALQFYYTFFLSRITFLNYLCWGILAFTVFILMIVKVSKGGLFTSNRSGLKAMLFLYIPLLIATAAISHPITHSQFLDTYEQIDKSPRPFSSAANYYLLKAFDTDAATREIITNLKTKLKTDDYDEIEALYAKIPSRYSAIPEVIGLADSMKTSLLQQKDRCTKAAIQAFRENNFRKLKSWLRRADTDNAEIQFIQGKCFDQGLADHKTDHAEAVKWYRKSAQQGHAYAQFNLGVCYENGEGVDKDCYEAFKWYRKSAEQGYANAQFNLGFFYAAGRGVVKDIDEAVKWYRKSADQGHTSAQNNLGVCYENGRGVVKDMSEAVKWFRKSAEQGYALAQFNLGVCYENGRGVVKDMNEAVKWYRKSAEQGYALAQNNLGVCYENGRGVVKDMNEAFKWYRKSAEQGYVPAQFNLGVCYENGRGVVKDIGEAVKWYRKAAEQGDSDAQYNLGISYEFGQGVRKDYAEALKWYRKAAAQNYSLGQFKLGYFYNNGLATEINYYEAVKWYRKAAEQGYALAQNNLGVCYENGRGVVKDMNEAFKWYRKAAEQDLKYAQNNLGVCYENGRGVVKDIGEAVKWYRKAAEQGHSGSQFNLGVCYEFGRGVAKNIDEAVKWYRKSAEQGHASAQNNLGGCYYAGDGVVKNYYEAVKLFRKSANQGNACAQNNLGVCYLNGCGVRQDNEEAVKWFRKAARQGHEGAQRRLKNAGIRW